MHVIENQADIAAGLAFLARRDRRLRKVMRLAGPVPLRRRPGGFPGLARIIVGQQLSTASAEAIWSRFERDFPAASPAALAAADETALRAVGLSRPKIRALKAAAAACRDGLDLDGLAALPAAEAHARLTLVKGVGPWTADIYLLFCLGHADIFPAGDLALRNAVAAAFGLALPVATEDIAAVAAAWSPWRGVAARLFWAYYRAARQRTGAPL
jgi:DNA-3-methyladenine glycosylase II